MLKCLKFKNPHNLNLSAAGEICVLYKGAPEVEERVITRRDFLKGAAGTALTAALGSATPGEAIGEQKSKVVLIRNAEVLGRHERVQGEILQDMLDEAL